MEYFSKFFFFYLLLRKQNILFSLWFLDRYTYFTMEQDSFLQCIAYKCWTEFIKEELNKITVRKSLTSVMKDTPVCSRGIFGCTNYCIVTNFSGYNFYSSIIYLLWILKNLIWLSFSLVFICCLSYLIFLNFTVPFLIQIMPLIRGSSIQRLDGKDKKKLLPLLGKIAQQLSWKEDFCL